MTEPICQDAICVKQQEGCDQRFIYLEKIIGIKFGAIDKAMALAAEEILRRMHESNGIRKAMEKQSEGFVDLTYYRSEHANIVKAIEELKTYRDIQVGKSSTNNLLSAIALLLSFIMTVLHFFPKGAS